MPSKPSRTMAPSKAGTVSKSAKSRRLPLRGKPSNSAAPSADVCTATSKSTADSKALSKTESTTDTSSTASTSDSAYLRRTSTEEFNQVPFDKISEKVRKLCEQLWPSSPKLTAVDRLMGGHGDRYRLILRAKRFNRALKSSAPSNDFIIERLRGGSFNRVFGITVMHSNGEKPTHLVLRVPRWPDAAQESDVAILRFVSQYTSVPVPTITHLDNTKKNPLKDKYVIQSRIYGHDLQNINKPFYYPTLSHEQKCIIARELAQIVAKLQTITHPYPGEIEAASAEVDNKAYSVSPFKIKSVGEESFDPEPDLNRSRSPFLQSHPYNPAYNPSENEIVKIWETNGATFFILTQLGRWRASKLRFCPTTIGQIDHFDRLAKAAMQMDELFGPGDDINCLCHLDFITAPRNIMVDAEKDAPLQVKAVLDWDSACFAPRFVGCEPPMWLWAWNEIDYEDERLANEVPRTPQQCEIKKIFEETVKKDFEMWDTYAYQPLFRLARELFRFARDGIRSLEEVEEFLEEWNPLFEELSAKKKAAAKGGDAKGEPTKPNQEQGEAENISSDEFKVKGVADTQGKKMVADDGKPSKTI